MLLLTTAIAIPPPPPTDVIVASPSRNDAPINGVIVADGLCDAIVTVGADYGQPLRQMNSELGIAEPCVLGPPGDTWPPFSGVVVGADPDSWEQFGFFTSDRFAGPTTGAACVASVEPWADGRKAWQVQAWAVGDPWGWVSVRADDQRDPTGVSFAGGGPLVMGLEASRDEDGTRALCAQAVVRQANGELGQPVWVCADDPDDLCEGVSLPTETEVLKTKGCASAPLGAPWWLLGRR